MRDAAGELEQVAHGLAELDLVDAGPGDIPAQTEELRSRRLLGAAARERRPPVEHDRRNVRQCLDVVHDGRQSEQSGLHGKWRLVPRLAAKSLDRVEDRRFLTTDVRARSTTNLDVEMNAAAEDVLPKEAVSS